MFSFYDIMEYGLKASAAVAYKVCDSPSLPIKEKLCEIIVFNVRPGKLEVSALIINPMAE